MKKKKNGLVIFREPKPFTLIIKGVEYLLVSTGRDGDIWIHTIKNVQKDHKDYGTFYNNVPDSKIKKYFK